MEISGKTQQIHFLPQDASIQREQRLAVPAPLQDHQDHAKDEIGLSNRGNKIKNAMRDVQSLPDVRAEKIAAIRKLIGSGAYRVESERIAMDLMTETEENNALLKEIDAER